MARREGLRMAFPKSSRAMAAVFLIHGGSTWSLVSIDSIPPQFRDWRAEHVHGTTVRRSQKLPSPVINPIIWGWFLLSLTIPAELQAEPRDHCRARGTFVISTDWHFNPHSPGGLSWSEEFSSCLLRGPGMLMWIDSWRASQMFQSFKGGLAAIPLDWNNIVKLTRA